MPPGWSGMGSGSACMGRTGTSRSCPSRPPARQVAGRHVVGQPDAVGGLIEGVAGRVHGRGVHRQDDGRLAARPPGSRSPRWRAHQVDAHISRNSATFSSSQSGPGSSQRVWWAYSHPTILEGQLRRRGPVLPSLPAPDPEIASARVVWRRSEPSRTLRCGLGSGSQVAGHRGGLGLRMESAESSSTWRDGRTRTGRSEPSPPRQEEVTGQARLSSVWPQPTSIDDIASRKAASSASEASGGVERRVTGIVRCVKHAYRRIPSGNVPQLAHHGFELVWRKPVRQPGVAELGDPLEGPPPASDVDRRARLLHRFGPDADRVEVYVLTVKLRLVFGPDLYHRPDALVRQLTAGAGVGAVIFHLFAVPTHAEDYSSSGYEVQACDFLSFDYRIPLDYQGYPRAEEQAFGCSGGKRDEGVKGSVVSARQLSAAGPRGVSAEGDVGMLGDEKRVETTF